MTEQSIPLSHIGMINMSINIPEDDDPLYRIYSNYAGDYDDLKQDPVYAGKNITILPPGSRKPDKENSTVLYLDSSRAFGDGSHPTTVLCLALIEEYLDSLTHSERDGISMLDIGTGTGVLAILGSVMGVGNIMALDLDPAAVSGAIELAAVNGADKIDFRVMDAALLQPVGSYGLVTANLLPPILRTVIPHAARISLPGAPVVVSGIGSTSLEEMERVMSESGLTIIKHITSGWWHAYLLNHR